MALCKDPALTYLNRLGYNVVRLPRAGIAPMDVLGREDGRVERLGDLDQIWSSTLPMPQPKPAEPASSINGKQTEDLKLSIGMRILEGILAGMGAAVPQLKFAYQHARSVQFTFAQVHLISVDPFNLGRYLAAGDLDSRNPFVAHYFDDEGCEAFVITEVLRSDTFTLIAKDEKGAEAGVDVPVIQRAVGAKVSVSYSGSRTTELVYKGQEPLAFGFKAFGIDYVDGSWRVRGMKPGQGMAYAIPDALGRIMDHPDPVLLNPAGRIVL